RLGRVSTARGATFQHAAGEGRAARGVTAMIVLMPRATDRLSREEKKAMTRRKLLDAAATVFARKGFAGASLDDVAEEAGLTKGAVYSNFASKDELIEVLLDTRLDEPQQNIAYQVDADASPEVQGAQAAALFMSTVER